MAKVKFVETRVVNDARLGTPAAEKFEAGKTYDLAPASAKRWIDRNAAVAVPDEVKAPAKPKTRRRRKAGAATRPKVKA